MSKLQRKARQILIAAVCTMLSSCVTPQSVQILGETVSVNSVPVVSNHDPRYLEVVGLDSLRYVAFNHLGPDEIEGIRQAFLGGGKNTHPSERLVFIYAYTTNAAANPLVISGADAHAVSVITTNGNALLHSYFERQSDGGFRRIASVPNGLDGYLNMDEIRMLHFAASEGSSLPRQSTIYEFRSTSLPTLDIQQSRNRTLMTTLLLDQSRNGGSRTVGLYGDSLYAALRADDEPGTGSCGNAQLCPPGGDGTCVPDDIAGYRCDLGGGDGGGDGCAGAQLSVFAETSAIGLPTPIEFRSIVSFRDQFLARSDTGKRYIGYMYVFSQFAKMDEAYLLKYASIVGPLQESIQTLMSGPDHAVVVSKDLRRQAQEIIDAHKDIQNSDFQDILMRMQEDLEVLTGLDKEKFTKTFEHRLL